MKKMHSNIVSCALLLVSTYHSCCPMSLQFSCDATTNHQPQIYICNNGTTRTCQSGFSTMSGLTHHQNAMHPPLNNHIQPSPPQGPPTQPPSSPPPDNMNITNTFNDNGHMMVQVLCTMAKTILGLVKQPRVMHRHHAIPSLMVSHVSTPFCFTFNSLL
jgi:hypothetical protein